MAKYKKRKDGRYSANVYLGADEKGKRKFETVYAYSIPDLENKKAEIKDRVNKGIYTNDKGMTVDKWAKKWYEIYKSNANPKTRDMYKSIVNKYIIPEFKDIRLRDLKKSDIQGLINKNTHHTRTCQQIHMTIKRILEDAIEDGLIYKNVCRNIDRPQYKAQEKYALSKSVKKAIQKADLTAKERAFVDILMNCGLRRGEALALTKNDVDTEDQQIEVSKVVVFDGSKSVLKNVTKTDAGMRTVPIPTSVNNSIEEYVDSLKGLYLFEMPRKGGTMTKTSYDYFWKGTKKKINIAAGGNDDINAVGDLSAHKFRHDYASMLYYAGVPAKEAQLLLGHSSIAITLDIYTHLDKTKSKAVNKIDDYQLKAVKTNCN